MQNLNLPDFSGRVLVVGDVMLDRYWKGPCSRISPEAPVPVVRVSDVEDRAGGAANVAINIATLGAPCNLCGIVGVDEVATKLSDIVEQAKVTCHFVSDSSLHTITKLRVLSRNQQLLRVDFEDAYETTDQGTMLQGYRRAIKECKVVICSDYGKGALSSIKSMIDIANYANIPVLIDPKGTDFSKYANATLLTPNMSEFEAVVGKVKDNEDLEKKALDLISRYNLKALLVTRSEDGMSLIVPGRKAEHLPTNAREVYDVTGAGDTVIGTIGACLASGSSLSEACAIANTAAGIVVGKLGTSTVSVDEIKHELGLKQNSSKSILGKEELLSRVAKLKAQGLKIVMTNGCFDILHKGHLDYLKRARALGDILIVAVNTDSSVQMLKGPSRPINALEDRMIMLDALECTSLISYFDEETPESLIAAVLPDILVKGGDYTVEQIAGHKQVLQNGGQVIILPFVDGCSTTNIVNKIKGSL